MAEQRLIDANALDFNFDRNCFNEFDAGYVRGCETIIMTVKNAPTVDAKPVVHAHWIYGKTIYGVEWMKCSACCKSQTPTGVFSYCPNCGAKMDEKEDKHETN